MDHRRQQLFNNLKQYDIFLIIVTKYPNIYKWSVPSSNPLCKIVSSVSLSENVQFQRWLENWCWHSAKAVAWLGGIKLKIHRYNSKICKRYVVQKLTLRISNYIFFWIEGNNLNILSLEVFSKECSKNYKFGSSGWL